MATYYVRTDGSDSNAGTSSGTGGAWLTIGKALGASGISSGDTLYIAPGTYRESVTLALTNPTAATYIYGDPTAAQFSGVTPGKVIISCFTTDDNTAPVATACLILGGRDYLNFQDISFAGGSYSLGACIHMFTSDSQHCSFTRCEFTGNSTLIYPQYSASVNADLLFDRCTFAGGAHGLAFWINRGGGADWDLGVTIKACQFFTGASGTAIAFSGQGTGFQPGGVLVTNCTIVACYFGVDSANTSTTIPHVVKNCIIHGCNTGVRAGASGQITEDYNRFCSCVTSRTNVTAGTNSKSTAYHAIDFGYSVMTGLDAQFPGWPDENGANDGYGTTTGAPTTDLYGGTYANPPTIGAVEVGDAIPAGGGGGLIVHPGMTGGMRG